MEWGTVIASSLPVVVDAVRIVEKPTLRNVLNAGIYLIQPDVCQMVPRDCPYDMPDLITNLFSAPKRGVCFPIREYWLDIGHIEQYRRAATDVAEGPFDGLPNGNSIAFPLEYDTKLIDLDMFISGYSH